jgi:hypothetical protein
MAKEHNFSLLQKLKNQNLDDYVTRIGQNGYVLVINNSLPDDLYNKLKNEYISLSDIVLLNNEYISLSDIVLLNNENENENKKETKKIIMMSDFLYKTTRIRSLLWKQFVEYHKSSNFFNDIIDLDLENNKDNNNVSVSRNTCKIEFNHHSPVLYNQQSRREFDIDNVSSSFLGYYFMRDEKDNSKGFNLEIYNTENDTEKRILSIPYQKNTFVLICNNNQKLKIKFSDKGFSIYSKKYIKLVLK